MMKLGSSRIAYQPGAVNVEAAERGAAVAARPAPRRSREVDIVPAVMNTATMDRPIATSYEIICALDRRPPSSG